jgi:hypothetical protein
MPATRRVERVRSQRMSRLRVRFRRTISHEANFVMRRQHGRSYVFRLTGRAGMALPDGHHSVASSDFRRRSHFFFGASILFVLDTPRFVLLRRANCRAQPAELRAGDCRLGRSQATGAMHLPTIPRGRASRPTVRRSQGGGRSGCGPLVTPQCIPSIAQSPRSTPTTLG